MKLALYMIGILVFLLCFGGGATAMMQHLSPPFSSLGERDVDQYDAEFVSCKEAFDEVIGANIGVVKQQFTYNELWGYTIRVVFHNFSDSGKPLPESIFLCWKKVDEPIGIAIAPFNEID